MPKDKELPDATQRPDDDAKPDAKIIDFLSTPTFRAKDDEVPVDPLTRTRIEVTLDQLRPSEVNPRTTRNPKYEDIKTSIRTRGLDHPPNITRVNPADGFYTIKDGGNTRLAILQELWDDTQDPRFYRIECTYVPYEGEVDTLVGHLVENDLRGAMLFIEKALAAVNLCEMIKAETGEDLSMRKLAGLITERGWTLQHPNLSRYQYAVNALLPALPTLLWSGAGHDTVSTLRAFETKYLKYWNTQTRPTGDSTFDAVFAAALSDIDDELLDEKALRDTLERGIAHALGIKHTDVAEESDTVAAGLPLNGPVPSTIDPGPDPLASLTQNTALDDPPTAFNSNTPTPTGSARHPSSSDADAIPQRSARPPVLEPESLTTLRQRCYEMALTLAMDWGFDELIDQWDDGMGFSLAPPDRPLNESSPQGGLFLQLYKLTAGAASQSQNKTGLMDLNTMLSKVFRDFTCASYAELLWTNTVIIPFTYIPGIEATRLTNLRTSYQALENTALRLAERYLEENHAA